jgi:hypothetical protein
VATAIAIVRALPGGSIDHILIAAYLYPPANVVSAHRPAGLRRAFVSAGVRTTVLTSEISGSYEDDREQGIIRAGDLRTRFHTQYQTLVGYREGTLDARARQRRWTNYIVPDPTALAWFPQALVHLLRVIRHDRPDVVLTTSGPESTHLLGLVASHFGICWVADYRDGWLRDVRHPALLRPVDRTLERRIARRSTIVTAVNDAIAAEVEQRHGVRAFTISNGFDRTAIARASDERKTLDPERFSLLVRGNLRKVVRVLGLLPRERALGLQQAADGLLLIPGGRAATTAKVFEYLAARKPIFAVTEDDGVAAELLREAGEHTVAEAGSAESLAGVLERYLARWTAASFQPRPGFDLEAYEYENLGKRLLQLLWQR